MWERESDDQCDQSSGTGLIFASKSVRGGIHAEARIRPGAGPIAVRVGEGFGRAFIEASAAAGGSTHRAAYRHRVRTRICVDVRLRSRRSVAGAAPSPRWVLGDRGIRNDRESPTRGKDRRGPSFTSEDGATSIEPTPSSRPTRPSLSVRVQGEAVQATSPVLTGRCLRGLSRKDPRRR